MLHLHASAADTAGRSASAASMLVLDPVATSEAEVAFSDMLFVESTNKILSCVPAATLAPQYTSDAAISQKPSTNKDDSTTSVPTLHFLYSL